MPEYQHYYPSGSMKREDFNLRHIKTIEEYHAVLNEVIKEDFIAMDLETTGLNPEKDRIVGFSFSTDKDAYYVPIGHNVGENLPKEALEEFYHFIRDKKILFYNAKFDMRFLKYAGLDVSRLNYFDVLVLVFNSDTNWKGATLKWSQEHFLGWKVPTYDEVTGGANMANLEPKDVYEYAAQDALGTYVLYFHLKKLLLAENKRMKFIFKVDNKLVRVLMEFEETKLRIDSDRVQRMMDDLSSKIAELDNKMFMIAGGGKTPKVFNPGSARHLTEIFMDLGIDTGERTSRGDMVTQIGKLELIDHEFTNLLVERKHLFQLKNAYLKKMNKNAIRIAYKPFHVPCLTQDAWVISKEGFKSIKDVRSGEKIITNSGWDEVKDSWCVGKAIVWKLKLTDGRELVGTSHHPVLTPSGLVNLESLKPGDIVDLSLDHKYVGNTQKYSEPVYEGRPTDKSKVLKNKLKIPKILNMEFYKLLGFIAGDGTISNDGVSLCFWIEDDDLIIYYNGLMFIQHGKATRSGFGKDKSVKYKYCSVRLRDFYINMEAKEDKVPEIVKRAGTGAFLNYLAGYFDADGSAICDKDGCLDIRISSKCRNRIREIHKILVLMGFSVTVREKGMGQLYLHFTGQSKERFMNEVPFASERKKIMKGFARRRSKQVKVESVEFEGHEVVYDIEMKNDPIFLANGIFTHNTGRLASGASEKDTFYDRINIQNIPKPHPMMYYAVPAEDGILGWQFFAESTLEEDQKSRNRFRDAGAIYTEGYDQHLNARSIFIPSEDSYFVSIDYDQQELFLSAMLSGEPVWKNAIMEGGDLHYSTAVSLWGQDDYDRDKRKIAKILNFGLLYGGTGGTVAPKLKCSKEEGQQYVDAFWRALRVLNTWRYNEIKKAYSTGLTYSYLGRPRRVKEYLSDPSYRRKAFGERTVINTQIQGLAADILRVVLINLYEKVLKDSEDVKFICTVHDEINFGIKKDKIKEVVPKIREIMEVKLPGFPKKLNTSVSVGTSWGYMFEFDDEWKPKRG